MSVMSSLYTGISGLQATGGAMGVIGDNIANAQTTAFKGSRSEFSDVISTNLKGSLGGDQIGRGVKMSGVTTRFSQGTLAPSERDADMAIRGDGFFVMKGPNGEVSYTRDGSFRFDEKGRIAGGDGHNVQGYKIDPSTNKASADLTNIDFSQQTIPAKGTAEVKIQANLDTRAPVNASEYNLETADKLADFTTSVRTYDSTGTAHNLNVHFYKREDSSWEWHASTDGAALNGGVAGVPQAVASGKLSFTQDGKLANDELLESNLNFRGATENQKIDFNFGDAIISRKGTGALGTTQYGSNSQVFKQVQDGYEAGTMTNFTLDDQGTISGLYSNGTVRPLAKVALAKFENNEGLLKAGSNRFKEAVRSGQPVIGAAGEGGRGTILSKTLENSNVDLANEFVSMMQTQRNFQANGKIITTSDELLQDVINFKR